ncbi:ABC transporter permease [Achromobacter insolitus]|uniref:ABC transporter permease n=1 Tax=Achromobacter insolitus TaxID=217204 RepID=UPI00366E2190
MLKIDKLKKIPLFIYVVLVPMLLMGIYYGFLSLDRYVSTAKMVVRQPHEAAGINVPSLALLMGSANPTSREETLFMQDFIQSIDMMNYLRQKLNWVEAYSDQVTDPLFYLSKEAPSEDLLKFYRRIVQTHFDEFTGLLEVEVQTPTPALSKAMLDEILTESERFVNELSHKIARDHLSFAERELGTARRNYIEKRDVLIAFQGANNLLDAKSSAISRAATLAGLEDSLTKERAHMKALRSTLDAQAPQVRQQQVKIRAIEQQLAAEKKELISSVGGEQLNVIASEYQNLTVDAGIAEESYKLAVTALENARIEASKKIRSLVTVVRPAIAERALYPDRLYNLATLFVLLVLLYGVARFVIATIEDHRD